MSDWLSFEQILGYVASFVLILGYGIKSDVKTKTILTVSSVIFTVHFFMLGAFAAAAVCVVNAIRNVSSIYLFKSKNMFYVFVLLYLCIAIFTYESVIDLLPVIAAFLTCIGMFLLGGIKFRMLVVIATLLWIIHNLYFGSIGGTINSVILFFISSTTVIRLHMDKRNSENV